MEFQKRLVNRKMNDPLTNRFKSVKSLFDQAKKAYHSISQEWEIKSAHTFLNNAEKLIESEDYQLAEGYIDDAQKYLKKFRKRAEKDFPDLKNELSNIEKKFNEFKDHPLYNSVVGKSVQNRLYTAYEYYKKRYFSNFRIAVNNVKKAWADFQYQISIVNLFEVFGVSGFEAQSWREKALTHLYNGEIQDALEYLNRIAHWSVPNRQAYINSKRETWYRHDLLRRFCKPCLSEQSEFSDFKLKMNAMRRAIESDKIEHAVTLSLEISERFIKPTTIEPEWNGNDLLIKGTAHPKTYIQGYIVPGNMWSEVTCVDESGIYKFQAISITADVYTVSVFNQTFLFAKDAYKEIQIDR